MQKNPVLYNQVKEEAKKRFSRYPSAYASAWIVKTYKSRGGQYYNKSTGKKTKKSGLNRWFQEKWIDVCELPRIVPCGRKSVKKNKSTHYPYCRPLKRVNAQSPKSVNELTKKELKDRCRKKQIVRKKSLIIRAKKN